MGPDQMAPVAGWRRFNESNRSVLHPSDLDFFHDARTKKLAPKILFSRAFALRIK
jgi:hypothetical protein